jgi:hypothetical protein
LEESRDEQLDHAAGIVARVVVGANAEAADATHQFVGINIGADLAGLGGGGEQLSANGHEAVKEVGMQRVEADAVGLQDRGESMLGDQKINEEVDPLTERRVRRATLRQQDRASLGAGLDLMAVHGNNEIRSRREVAVNRSHPDASRSRDVTHRRLDTGRDEHGGGGEQRLLVALRVGPPADREAAVAVLREAMALGITHIDTSDYYGPYITNQIIKEALYPYPDSLHIVTKVGSLRDAEGGAFLALAPEQLRQAMYDNLGIDPKRWRLQSWILARL